MLKTFEFLRLSESDILVINETKAMLVREIPPENTKEQAKRLSVNKVTRIIERAVKKITEHKETHKLGRIRWVRLLNEIRWTLHNAGYSRDFVSLMSEAILAKSVSVKNEKKPDVA